MNKLIKSSVAAALALSASSALAANAGEMYASLGLGYAFGNYKIKDNNGNTYLTTKAKGFDGNMAVGYYITDQVRTDLNLTLLPSYSGTGKDASGNKANRKISLNQYLILANVSYDIEIGSAVTPYITAGLGTDIQRHKITNTQTGAPVTKSGAKIVFAYQLGLGAAYPVTSNISLDVGYRFTGKSNAKDKLGNKLYSNGDHSFLLTSRFTF